VSAPGTPLRDGLAPPLRDGDARRLWRSINARRPPRAPHVPVWRAALAGAALAALVLAAVSVWPRPGRGKPLALADGRDLAVLEIPLAAADDAVLSDGSHIARDRGARLRVLESTDSVVDVLLEGGRTRFHVQKGGPRRWIIECGLVSVEVVGTELVVERGAQHARVEVIEGAVLVRGDRVPDRVKRLGAGEALEVRAEPSASERAANLSPEPSASAPASATSAAPAAPAASTPASSRASVSVGAWRELARTAAYDRAYDSLGRGGIAQTSVGASVDVLLALADVARLSGHPDDAVGPLTEIADQHAGDPRASLAMFTLGRVLLDRAPLLAARRFEQAIAGGLPASLVEDAMAHVVEARGRAGDRQGAEAAAARYQGAYPNGPHREAIKGWSGAP